MHRISKRPHRASAHRFPTILAIGILAVVIAAAAWWLVATGLRHELPGQTGPDATRDLNGRVVRKPSDAPAPASAGPDATVRLASPAPVPKGAADLTGGLSVPAIGMHHMPVAYMSLPQDWSINPPDVDSWWVARDRGVSPGLYDGGHGRIVMAAHSSSLPGIVAGNPIMGQGGGSQHVTRQAMPGDIVEVGSPARRYRIDRVESLDRDTVSRSPLFQHADGLVLLTCDRRRSSLGDWRYKPYPQYTFIITATPVADR